MRDSLSLRRATKTVLPLLVFILFLSCFIINNLYHSDERWYSLLVTNPEKLNETELFLQEKGMKDIVSSNLPVFYSDFTELKQIPLNQLSHRFLSEDRRFDPVLKELSEFFMTKQGERVFFLSDRSAYEMRRVLWGIRESSLLEQKEGILFLLGPLLYLLLGVSIAGLYRRDCYYPLLIFISWLPFLYFRASQWGLIIPSLIILEISLLEGHSLRKYQFPVICTLFLTALVSFLTGQGIQLLIQILLTLLLVKLILYIQKKYDAFFMPGANSKKRFASLRKKTEHTLFEPVFFNRRRHRKKNKPRNSADGRSLILLIPFTLILLIPIPAMRINHIEMVQPDDIMKHLNYQRSILFRESWDSQNMVQEYKWEKESGKIIPSTMDMSDKLVDMPGLDSRFIYSLFLNPVMLEGSIGFFTDQHFYKYIYFSIITVFFLYTVLFLSLEFERKDRLFFTSNRRGRKVA